MPNEFAASDTFDFVTCQTVLIHLPKPWVVLADFEFIDPPGNTAAASA